ncbi:MAG: hypothetical protein JWP14_2075 [Frankiales bacterium]|nr:hypothetical protein [Frankiales bacterium]
MSVHGIRGNVALTGLALVAAMLPSGCHATPSDRVTEGVTGDLGVCYGPATNLRPETTVDVRQEGVLVRTVTFETNESRHDYRIDLQPGTYRLHAANGSQAVDVTVRSGSTTVQDLVGTSCY